MNLTSKQRHDREIAQTAMQSLARLIAKANPDCGEQLLLSLRDTVWSQDCEITMAHLFSEVLEAALGQRLGT